MYELHYHHIQFFTKNQYLTLYLQADTNFVCNTDWLSRKMEQMSPEYGAYDNTIKKFRRMQKQVQDDLVKDETILSNEIWSRFETDGFVNNEPIQRLLYSVRNKSLTLDFESNPLNIRICEAFTWTPYSSIELISSVPTQIELMEYPLHFHSLCNIIEKSFITYLHDTYVKRFKRAFYSHIFYFASMKISQLYNRKISIAFAYYDMFIYRIFFERNGECVFDFITNKDILDYQLYGKLLIYQLQHLSGFDLNFFIQGKPYNPDYMINDPNADIICHFDKYPSDNGKCHLCPLNQDECLFYEHFLQYRIQPRFFFPDQNTDKKPREFVLFRQKCTCSMNENMSLLEFMYHIEYRIKNGCFDHLALKCYLMAVHGSVYKEHYKDLHDPQDINEESIFGCYPTLSSEAVNSFCSLVKNDRLDSD